LPHFSHWLTTKKDSAMSKAAVLSLEGENIIIQGLDTITKFTRFHPINVNLFLDGLELAEDLRAETGTILYTKDNELSHERVAKLLRLRESNPNLDFNFKIKRNEKLLNKFREELMERMQKLLKRRQTRKVFKDLMVVVTGTIESHFEKILEDQNITLELYQLRFVCESAKSQKARFFFDHCIDMALFSLAIASSHKFEEHIGKDNDKPIEIIKAALFHNYGALMGIDEVLELPANERPNKYLELIRGGMNKVAELRFSYEIMMAIRNFCDYQAGRRDFVAKLEGAELMANILVVVDIFLQKESGLFGEPMETRTVVDQMNVKVMEKELNELTIQALTLGLNLTDIFDFYSELERLVGKCPYESAVSYPLTGFNSPTIFVCKKKVAKCEYLESTVKAVNLITKLGELQPGEYNRCKLLTPELLKFYEEHYDEIKESTSDKPKFAKPAAGGPAAAKKTASSAKSPSKAADTKSSSAAKPPQAKPQKKS